MLFPVFFNTTYDIFLLYDRGKDKVEFLVLTELVY